MTCHENNIMRNGKRRQMNAFNVGQSGGGEAGDGWVDAIGGQFTEKVHALKIGEWVMQVIWLRNKCLWLGSEMVLIKSRLLVQFDLRKTPNTEQRAINILVLVNDLSSQLSAMIKNSPSKIRAGWIFSTGNAEPAFYRMIRKNLVWFSLKSC